MANQIHHNNRKDSAIATAVTLLVALLLFLGLWFGGVTFDRSLLAEVSTPEISVAEPEEEELFVEPEITRDLGEETAETQDAPAPAFKGQPEEAPKENTRQVVPDKNPKPAPPVEKPITQSKESPVKATTPTISEEEKKKVTSSIANKFKTNDNGTETGKTGSVGAGGTGVGISGSVSGRTFLGCPKPSVSLSNKTTITVVVTIDAEGHVTSAKARNGEAYLQRACEQAALKARWSKKEDTPSARGTLTFTITPR